MTGSSDVCSSDLYYNPYSKTIYFRDWNNSFVKYSLEGKYLDKIVIPEFSSSLESPSFAEAFSFLNENRICAFFSNLNGAETKRIMIFSETGDIIKLFPNNRIIKTKRFSFLMNDGIFYRNNDKLYFKETFVDTVYVVSEKELSPAYVIDQSKYNVAYERRYDNIIKFQPLNHIIENNEYIILHLIINDEHYYTIYDKKKHISLSYVAKKGFIDNINNFVPFMLSTVSYDGSFVGIVEAHILYGELEKIKNENRPELAHLFKVKEDDNPILVIVR